jgi:hypothetical protein
VVRVYVVCVLRAHRGLNVQINGVQVEGAIDIGYLYIYISTRLSLLSVCMLCSTFLLLASTVRVSF